MALTQRLELRQTQSLVMTPQLQQAIKLLQLSNQEVAAFVDTELEQNPLLEREETDSPAEAPDGAERAPEPAEPANGSTATAEAPANGTAALDEDRESETWESDDGDDSGFSQPAWRGGSERGRADFDADDRSIEETLSRAETLRDHLVGQLNVDIPDPADRVIGLQLIDMLDERGYLAAPLADAAQLLGCPVARVEAVLIHLQRFDPPGVFARELKECLALQLKDRDRLDPAMQALLDNLPLLARRDAGALRRLCGVDAEDLAEMVAELKALDPRPASAFDQELAQPITPDILMRAQAGGWIIELNADTLPRVLVNNRYYARINRNTLNKSEREYLTERLQAANWLIKSLHQRATTILKVATEIVRQQDAFFRRGVSHLKPLILRDIAAAIEMHESTVSRVTTNKYIATPRGLYELKYFFTSSIASTAGGEAHSAESVRHRIRGLIGAEPADHVLSDDRIVEILKVEGMDIARRTVAKYREAMKIPSSVQRRREKTSIL